MCYKWRWISCSSSSVTIFLFLYGPNPLEFDSEFVLLSSENADLSLGLNSHWHSIVSGSVVFSVCPVSSTEPVFDPVDDPSFWTAFPESKHLFSTSSCLRGTCIQQLKSSSCEFLIMGSVLDDESFRGNGWIGDLQYVEVVREEDMPESDTKTVFPKSLRLCFVGSLIELSLFKSLSLGNNSSFCTNWLNQEY